MAVLAFVLLILSTGSGESSNLDECYSEIGCNKLDSILFPPRERALQNLEEYIDANKPICNVNGSCTSINNVVDWDLVDELHESLIVDDLTKAVYGRKLLSSTMALKHEESIKKSDIRNKDNVVFLGDLLLITQKNETTNKVIATHYSTLSALLQRYVFVYGITQLHFDVPYDDFKFYHHEHKVPPPLNVYVLSKQAAMQQLNTGIDVIEAGVPESLYPIGKLFMSRNSGKVDCAVFEFENNVIAKNSWLNVTNGEEIALFDFYKVFMDTDGVCVSIYGLINVKVIQYGDNVLKVSIDPDELPAHPHGLSGSLCVFVEFHFSKYILTKHIGSNIFVLRKFDLCLNEINEKHLISRLARIHIFEQEIEASIKYE